MAAFFIISVIFFLALIINLIRLSISECACGDIFKHKKLMSASALDLMNGFLVRRIRVVPFPLCKEKTT